MSNHKDVHANPEEQGWKVDEDGNVYRDWTGKDFDQYWSYCEYFESVGRKDLVERYAFQLDTGELPDVLLNRMVGAMAKLPNRIQKNPINNDIELPHE